VRLEPDAVKAASPVLRGAGTREGSCPPDKGPYGPRLVAHARTGRTRDHERPWQPPGPFVLRLCCVSAQRCHKQLSRHWRNSPRRKRGHSAGASASTRTPTNLVTAERPRFAAPLAGRAGHAEAMRSPRFVVRGGRPTAAPRPLALRRCPHLYSSHSLACSLRNPCPSYPKSRQRAEGSSLTPWGDGSLHWPFMSRACGGVFRMICRRA
jgi:hypothetical protein